MGGGGIEGCQVRAMCEPFLSLLSGNLTACSMCTRRLI